MSVFSQPQPHRRSSVAEGLDRVAKTIDKFVEAWTEARAMAREAQRRYPFAIE